MPHKQLRESLDTIIDMVFKYINLDIDTVQSVRLSSRDHDHESNIHPNDYIEIYEWPLTNSGHKKSWNSQHLKSDEYTALFEFRECYRFQKKKDFVANYVLLHCGQHHLKVLEWVHNLTRATYDVRRWYDWEKLKDGVEFLHFMNGK